MKTCWNRFLASIVSDVVGALDGTSEGGELGTADG